MTSFEYPYRRDPMTGLTSAVRETIDRKTAIRRLTNRYAEQCEQWPTLRQRIPLQLYIQRNIQAVMNGSAPLADYDRG